MFLGRVLLPQVAFPGHFLAAAPTDLLSCKSPREFALPSEGRRRAEGTMSVAWIAAVLLWSDADGTPLAVPDSLPPAAAHVVQVDQTARADQVDLAKPAVLAKPADPSERRDLRAATYAAMRASRARGAEPRQFVPQLIAVYEQLRSDDELRVTERAQLRRMVAKRLAEVGLELLRDLKKAEAAAATDGRPATARLSSAAGYRIADDVPQSGSAGGGPDMAGARELVELIRTTIAPETWDVNGGRGSIIYYSPLKVLVIRQTSEVHELIHNLQDQLRK
jgi:hypothetical protein